MYDAIADEEIVLEAATETSDFILMSLSEDGVVVLEEYVDSPDDWADPENSKTRELSVPLPAAG